MSVYIFQLVVIFYLQCVCSKKVKHRKICECIITFIYRFLGCRAVDDMNADILKYYTTGVDMPLCPALTHVTKSCDAGCVHQLIDDWLIELPDGKTTMWQVRNNVNCKSRIFLNDPCLDGN